MEKERLKRFIQTSLKEGHNSQDIKEALIKVGESPGDIDQAFKELGQTPPPTAPSQVETTKAESSISQDPGTAFPQTSVFQNKNQIGLSKRKLSKRILASKTLIISALGVFIFALVAGASFYIYENSVKVSPLSFIPQDSPFYLRVNLDPQSQQIKNLKVLLERFPNYDLVASKIKDVVNKIKKDNAIPKNISLNIAKEITLSIYQTPNQAIQQKINQTSTPSLIVVFSNLDLKKASRLAKFLKSQEPKAQSQNSKEIRYRGKTITRYFEKLSKSSQPEETDLITIKKNLILTDKEATAKKIIDSYLDHKNILSLPAYKKLKSQVAGDYLATGYVRLDLAKSFLGSGNNLTANRITPLSNNLWPASLKSLFDSLKSKIRLSSTPPQNIAMFTISANSQGLISKSYYPSTKPAFPFSLKKSLLTQLPQKIDNQEIVYYSEGKNLNAQIQAQLQQLLTASTTSSTTRAFFNKDLNSIVNVNLEKDILPLFQGNYAFLTASEPSGKQTPIIGFIGQINDENKARDNFLKIKILKELTQPLSIELQQSQLKAKDAKTKADLHQLRMIAELIYSDKNSYRSLSCYNQDYPQLKALCNDTKKNSGDYPVIRTSRDKYCAYAKLNEPHTYFCVDSSGRALKTYTNPGNKGYCNGYTFSCPVAAHSYPPGYKASPKTQFLQGQRVSFTKKTINGLDIYSMPFVAKDLSISFAIKNKILFLVLGDNNLVATVNNYFANNPKFSGSQSFHELFADAPNNIEAISYSYPYGYLGLIKYTINFFINAYSQSMMQTSTKENNIMPNISQPMLSMYLAPIYEFIDKGIGPYLKVLHLSGSYTSQAKNGLTVKKSEILIKALPAQEKKDCEKFWQNFATFLNQKTNMLPF